MTKLDDRLTLQNVRLHAIELTVEDNEGAISNLERWAITIATFATLSTILSVAAIAIVVNGYTS